MSSLSSEISLMCHTNIKSPCGSRDPETEILKGLMGRPILYTSVPPNGSFFPLKLPVTLGSSSEHSYPFLAAPKVPISRNDFSGGSAPKEQN